MADRSLVGLMGLYTDPYLFYFHAGKNTIRLISRREPMLIHHLRLFQVEAPPSYAELAAEYSKQGFKPAEGVFLKLQERDSSYRSDANLAPGSRSRRSNPRTLSSGAHAPQRHRRQLEPARAVDTLGLHCAAVGAVQNRNQG